MNVAFRVLFAAVLCITPSVLFLGLWHGLQRMRDDELLARIADQRGVTVADLVPGARSSDVRSQRAGESIADRRDVWTATDGTADATEGKNSGAGDGNGR